MNIRTFMVAAAFSMGALAATPSWAVVYFEYNGMPGDTTTVATPGTGIAIQEHFDTNTGQGSYSVQNNSGSFGLLGFGVSNPFSIPYVDTYGSSFGCQSSWCYGSVLLTAGNWGTEEVSFDSAATFQDVFGDFSDNVDDGEFSINWYRAEDGDLQPGDSSSDFFLFDANVVASIGLGVLGPIGPGGSTIFFNGLAVNPPSTNPIPGPAALPLLASALGFFGFVGWRRRQKKLSAAA